ncbi:MAG: magnesium chelatase subunit H [Myxococcota bacterium]
MPRRTSRPDASTSIVVVILTLDHHIAGAVLRAREQLAPELPGLELRLHAATRFEDPEALASCRADIARADIVFANMLFLEPHIRAVLPDLTARRDHCDAMVCAMSAAEITRLTRMGDLRLDREPKGPMALLQKLRGTKGAPSARGGASQLAMLRQIPRLLKYVPGTAQDLRTYLLTLAYWTSGSTENLADLIRMLVRRYADGPRRALRDIAAAAPPRAYPDTGLYHPEVGITEDVDTLPGPATPRGTVGLVLLRSYVLAGDAAHYDDVIQRLEARGYRVIPAFAAGLDARPAIERYFERDGDVRIDALVSLTGFSLVGGPAFNDARAAEDVLARLDVPYVAAQPLEFQTVAQWEGSATGLSPIEATIMVSIPELDGATGPIVYAGRDGGAAMVGIKERIDMLAARVDGWIRLRKTPAAERNLAVVLFNFPPNAGATGTAAFLSVFQSLHRTLIALRQEGYDVDVPPTVEALRARVLDGNAERYGTDANVAATIATDDHVRREAHLDAIEAQWGAAPGKQCSDGRDLFVLGARFGRVFVGVQPGFGYEGDPMRLLHASGFAPTHAFSAFYRYLREDVDAHAVLHFGTHGALEFMPGKQVGLSEACWPDRLIGAMPNIYLYAANNPSEGALARRRAAATLVSYLTPPVQRAGLYRGLLELRHGLTRVRSLPPGDAERRRMLPVLQAQAAELELADAEPAWTEPDTVVERLHLELVELEQSLIPHGLHVIGAPMSPEARVEMLVSMADAEGGEGSDVTLLPMASLEALVAGHGVKAALKAGSLSRADRPRLERLAHIDRQLADNRELAGLMAALRGGFVRPAPGGDLTRNPEVLPTGRNLHGFDPFGMPSAFAMQEGAEQAQRLLDRHLEEAGTLPRSVAMVLWGTDNLKSGGGPIAQALALMGARPRFDGYGRLSGAELLSLEELGRPRIDTLITLSGIFRDLLPLQTRLLAEAAFLAASADERPEDNFIRAHALDVQAARGCDLETAALRVYSNAEGAYGANVNQLVEAGTWEHEDDLADAYEGRKCFAYGRTGEPMKRAELLRDMLGKVDLAYQNLESVELGVTTIDHYFDTLGGIGRAVRRARDGAETPVYIGDQTRSRGRVRTLNEQVGLESRTRSLNPRWAEAMLDHGAEGVRQIEAQVTNTLGWSATTTQVDPWVYRELTKTYVLDDEMRRRLAALNPKASLKLAQRLLEASERRYWEPDAATLAALEAAGDELEDRLEGLNQTEGAA